MKPLVEEVISTLEGEYCRELLFCSHDKNTLKLRNQIFAETTNEVVITVITCKQVITVYHPRCIYILGTQMKQQMLTLVVG